MIELAVTAVVATVTVPLTSVTVPKELAPAAAAAPTLVLTILFPAVLRTRLPFVAVMLPKVAVSVVVAVIDPGATTTAGRENVTVLPAPASDGSADNDFVPAGGFVLYDFTSNSAAGGSPFVFQLGTQFWVRQSTAPTTGSIYLTVVYAKGE